MQVEGEVEADVIKRAGVETVSSYRRDRGIFLQVQGSVERLSETIDCIIISIDVHARRQSTVTDLEMG